MVVMPAWNTRSQQRKFTSTAVCVCVWESLSLHVCWQHRRWQALAAGLPPRQRPPLHCSAKQHASRHVRPVSSRPLVLKCHACRFPHGSPWASEQSSGNPGMPWPCMAAWPLDTRLAQPPPSALKDTVGSMHLEAATAAGSPTCADAPRKAFCLLAALCFVAACLQVDSARQSTHAAGTAIRWHALHVCSACCAQWPLARQGGI